MGSNDPDQRVSIRVHEARNALASVIGCARTVAEAGEGLDPAMRDALLGIVVNQALKLDWTIRASAALAAPGVASDQRVDARSLLADAIGFAGLNAVGDTPMDGDVLGDERRLHLAVQALMLALRPNGEEGVVVASDGDGFRIRTTMIDLDHPDRGWKIATARRLMREQGGGITVRRTGQGIEARVRFRTPTRAAVTQ